MCRGRTIYTSSVKRAAAAYPLATDGYSIMYVCIYIYRLAASNRLADVRVVSGAAASNKNAPGRSRARKSGIATGKMAGDRLPPRRRQRPRTLPVSRFPVDSATHPFPARRPFAHPPAAAGPFIVARARPLPAASVPALSRCPPALMSIVHTRAAYACRLR